MPEVEFVIPLSVVLVPKSEILILWLALFIFFCLKLQSTVTLYNSLNLYYEQDMLNKLYFHLDRLGSIIYIL